MVIEMAHRITKKAQRIYDAAAWRLALSDGRVISYNGGMTMESHPTRAGAAARVEALLVNDPSARLVSVPANPDCVATK
jgi:hypothetical protein